jgi:hypothetical protein
MSPGSGDTWPRLLADTGGFLNRRVLDEHTFQVTAWRSGPYWVLSIEPPPWQPDTRWTTHAVWWRNCEYVARDYLVRELGLQDRHPERLKVSITRTSPTECAGHKNRLSRSSRPRAWRAGLRETWARWRTRNATRY